MLVNTHRPATPMCHWVINVQVRRNNVSTCELFFLQSPDLKVFTFYIVNQNDLHFQKVTVTGSFRYYPKEIASQIISKSQVNK